MPAHTRFHSHFPLFLQITPLFLFLFLDLPRRLLYFLIVRPITLLLTLLLAATMAGAWIFTNYQRHLLLDPQAGPAASADGSAPSGASYDEVALLKKNLDYFKEQVDLLRKENENLSAAVRKLSDQISTADGPDGQPAGFSPESLVREVEAIRELKFDPPPKFVRVPVTELEQKIKQAVSARITEEQARSRERAAQALGLAYDPFDLIDGLTGLTMEQAGGHYDVVSNELYIDESFDFAKRPDLKGRLVKEIAYALVQQQFQAAGIDEFYPANEDVALANRAFLIGDAVATKIHHGVVDALNTDYSREQAPATPTAFTGAPLFLRQQFLFPYMMGSTFSQEMTQDGGPKALDALYNEPPGSTAEILHPELYTATPRFSAITVNWPDVLINDTLPYADNVLGEFTIYQLLKARLPEDPAFEGAKGWAGDRYVCYPGPEGQKGDHLYWRTHWQTEQDAQEFLKAAQTVWLHRYSIPPNPRYEQPDGSTLVDDPGRVIHILLGADKKTVNITDSPDAAFVGAMEAHFAQP